VTDDVEGAPGLRPDDLAELGSVQRWLQAYGAFWGETSTADEVQRKLQLLADFCGFCDGAPDELVERVPQQLFHEWIGVRDLSGVRIKHQDAVPRRLEAGPPRRPARPALMAPTMP